MPIDTGYDHLVSDGGCSMTCGGPCQWAAKKEIRNGFETGRWFITMGHAGYNSPANNRSGYSSKAQAVAANARYSNKRRKGA